MPHHVYVWLRPDGTPFYVGVGNRRRLRSVSRNSHCNHVRRSIEAQGSEIGVVVIDVATREQALALESALIRRHGRLDLGTGTLTNMTDGGEGAPVLSAEARERMRTNLGRQLSEETRRRMAEAKRGRRHTDEARERMRGPRGKYRPRGTAHLRSRDLSV